MKHYIVGLRKQWSWSSGNTRHPEVGCVGWTLLPSRGGSSLLLRLSLWNGARHRWLPEPPLYVEDLVWSLCGQSVGCSGSWVKRRRFYWEVSQFWLLGKTGVTFSLFLVSYCKARKEACGLRQCQTPLWSPANCKEEGWNQNCKGKAIRRICSLPFFLEGLLLPTEQLLSSPVPPHCVFIEFIERTFKIIEVLWPGEVLLGISFSFV